MTRARLLARVLASAACAAIVAGVASCGTQTEEEPVTACAVSGPEAECERRESFVLAGAEIVVDELTTTTESNEEGTNGGWITADLSVDGAPSSEFTAQLHIVDQYDGHESVYEPEDPDDVLSQGGTGAVTWDFSGTEYPASIAVGLFLPNVFLVFSDGATDVTVRVIEVEVS